MSLHTYWVETEVAATMAVAEAKRDARTLSATYSTTNADNYRVEIDTADESWNGKTGHVEHVYNLSTDDGKSVYWVETDDGHFAGSFPSERSARAWAKRKGVKLRPGITARRSCLGI